jgi:hypothetical protein
MKVRTINIFYVLRVSLLIVSTGRLRMLRQARCRQHVAARMLQRAYGNLHLAAMLTYSPPAPG